MNNDKTYNSNTVNCKALDVFCKALEDSCMEGQVTDAECVTDSIKSAVTAIAMEG